MQSPSMRSEAFAKVVAFIGAILGISLFPFAGFAAIWPVGFAVLFFFICRSIEQSAVRKGRMFGGFGDSFPKSTPFHFQFVIQGAHLSWATLGFVLLFAAGREPHLIVVALFDYALYLALFVFFVTWPTWVSLALLAGLQLVEMLYVASNFTASVAVGASMVGTSNKVMSYGVLVHGLLRALATIYLVQYAWLKWTQPQQIRSELASHSFQSAEERLQALDDLRLKGLISESDLDAKRREILQDV